MKRAWYLMLPVILLACVSNPEEPKSESSNGAETLEPAIEPVIDSNAQLLLPVCQSFYEKVCNKNPSPGWKLNTQGFYELDMESYKRRLSSLGIFTADFIQSRDAEFAECREAMERDSIAPDELLEGIQMEGPAECGFFHYAYYFQAQEYPEGFVLKRSKIEGKKAFTEMHFYVQSGDQSTRTWDQMVYLKIDLKLIEGVWKIDRVRKIISVH